MDENLNILVVDDEECILDVFKRYFESETNHTLFTASDGFEAFEIIRSESINCCFTDLAMPRLDGLELARKILSQSRFKWNKFFQQFQKL